MKEKDRRQTHSLPRVIFLKGRKTTLRPILATDIPLLTRWINDPDVRPFVSGVFPVTEGQEQEWFAQRSKKDENDIILVIEADGRPIGSMGIHRINWQTRVATTGALIGEKTYWNKGYGTDAKMALLQYAFDTLNLRKIMSQVKAFNERSVAYSLKCGYKIEGRLRRQHFAFGRYWDEVILGLFRSDWLPKWREYTKGRK